MNKVIHLFGNTAPFRLVIMPGSNPLPAATAFYESAFKLWHDVWSATLKELDGLPKLHSDQFTRQDLIGGIFQGSRCVALTCFRRCDLKLVADRCDSWFLPWPEEALIDLGQQYPAGLANSFFTVHPDFRRSKENGEFTGSTVNVSTLLTEFVTLIGLESGADVIYGVTRNNRSVNKLARSGGAIPLKPAVEHHGVEVDLIGFFRPNMERAIVGFSDEIKSMWNQRLEFTGINIGERQKYGKTA